MRPSINMPTSIMISGVESERYWDIVVRQCGVRLVLMSYHYLQNKPKDFLKKRVAEFPDIKIFIDSGAHTFLSNEEWKNAPLSTWEGYLKTYTNFIRENKDYIFACADLDIDSLVGVEQVDKWREEVFEPLRKETGVDVCYVWHAERGEQGWEEMCQKYGYVGFSMENDKEVTLQRVMRRLKVAEKYKTRVHGFALTKVDVLVRAPFFTADSTTWLVGQQYGELNWFNGRKMQRLSKDQWRRQYKTQLLKEPFNANWDLLINGMGGRGDTYELLRLNVIAYKLAEEHIRARLKNKMYWMPKAGEILDANTLETPPLEWFDGECKEWKEYLMKLRIMPSGYSKEEAVNLLMFFYIFLNDDYETLEKDYDEQVIIDYARALLSPKINSYEEAVAELKDYFVKNATGERNDLRGEDDLEEELNSFRPKEREEYLEEDEFEIIDLSEEQINSGLQLEAPKSMPEVDAYDEELMRNDITPVRDNKGRFLKGQKKVRKPKNIYSEKYPKLYCSTCYKSGDCPEYQEGYVCAYDKLFKRFDTRNEDDVVNAMSSMVNFNLERLQRAMMFEMMDGGMATQEVTQLIDQNARLLEKMKGLLDNNPKTILEQRRVLKADGSEEVTTSMGVNPQGEGILSKIFGSPNFSSEETRMKEKEEMEEEVIEVEYESVDAEES